MQIKLTVFALQQFCVNEETLELAWETLQTFYNARAARNAQKELLAQNADYELRVVAVKQTATL